jgi:hypothetical protein
VLANGAEAGIYPLALTPILEQVAPELLALVGDDIFRLGTCVFHGVLEKRLNRWDVGEFLNVATVMTCRE